MIVSGVSATLKNENDDKRKYCTERRSAEVHELIPLCRTTTKVRNKHHKI